ncbi:hypothetical protein [Clostridiisalibacter paucivorans]|uniref:hypothetical protein n=1 Tax=Clostridiisalibacter paucivorans TaxID=408753 RepID=UPI0012EB3C36|nr:hypothetical protein [Clostridiisalibacter paucivorans]
MSGKIILLMGYMLILLGSGIIYFTKKEEANKLSVIGVFVAILGLAIFILSKN